ncbi:hypothetical protein SMKC058_08630 [Serratia marcescens]|nr:hypothetical protein SMKC058_08630 [Serratia marcescens]
MARLLIITDNAFTYTGREKICDFMVESLGGVTMSMFFP